MADNKENQDTISKTIGSANNIHRAVKTEKAISNIAKGISTGGSYGALPIGVMQNRKMIKIIILSIGFLMLLPILFVMMLPSLIFGKLGFNNIEKDVLNNNTVIMSNIEAAENAIETILIQRHQHILDQIQKDIDSHSSKDTHTITDEYADQIIFNSILLISQYCASKNNYEEININDLSKIISSSSDNLFSYSVSKTKFIINEKTGKTATSYHYIVNYVGDSYFADNIFHLTNNQLTISEEYAINLHTFLFENIYKVDFNLNLQSSEIGSQAVEIALTKLGVPYSQEYRNQDGYFDCSSFTYWVYSELGITLSHGGSNTAAAQGQYIVENNLAISYDLLAPGDLIFYSTKVNNRFMNITHIAIYCGEGMVVDASFSKKKVVYRSIYDLNSIVLCGRPYK